MSHAEYQKAKLAVVAFLLWWTIILLVLLSGCDFTGPTPPSNPEPWIRIDTATVHYWGDRGLVAVTTDHAPPGARVHVFESLCNRTLIDDWLPQRGQMVRAWQTEWKCPPSPYGYDPVHAILYIRDSVLATDVHKQYDRFGRP